METAEKKKHANPHFAHSHSLTSSSTLTQCFFFCLFICGFSMTDMYTRSSSAAHDTNEDDGTPTRRPRDWFPDIPGLFILSKGEVNDDIELIQSNTPLSPRS